MSHELSTRLKEAQTSAQSDDPIEAAKGIISLPNWPTAMEVAPRRAGAFAYRIHDSRFDARLSSPAAKKYPLIYAQCASKHLTLAGVVSPDVV